MGYAAIRLEQKARRRLNAWEYLPTLPFENYLGTSAKVNAMQNPSMFFQALYSSVSHGYAEIRLIHKDGDFSKAKKIYRPATTIHTGDFDYLAELNQDYHICNRVNVSANPASKKADISQVVALWLEIDSSDTNIPERLTEADFPPTMLIHSGSGYHAYWLLKTPLMVDSERTRHEVERTLEGMILDWGIESGGDKHTKDITRILRTPFYRNVKDKYAPNYPLCTPVWYDDSLGDRYKFEYLHKRYAHLGAPLAPTIRRELPVLQKGQYPKWIEQWLSTGAPQGERNKRLYDVSRALWDMGYDHLEILNIVSERARSDGLYDSEISTTIKSACSNARNLSTPIPNHMKRIMRYEDTE